MADRVSVPHLALLSFCGSVRIEFQVGLERSSDNICFYSLVSHFFKSSPAFSNAWGLEKLQMVMTKLRDSKFCWSRRNEDTL